MKSALQLIGAAVTVAGCVWIFASGSRKKSSTTEEVLQPEATPEIVYHGNTGSRVFHDPSCKYYKSKLCSESFDRREDAIEAGFKPCTLCLP